PPASLTALASFLPAPAPPPVLPPSTPAEQRAALVRAVSSPEFRRALASLDRALRTGATGPLVQGLGLRERAAQGPREFLDEVQRCADEAKAEEDEEDGGAGASEEGGRRQEKEGGGGGGGGSSNSMETD
ncbi:hypothetical protein JCM21900_000977, partial [Sporobolomyces salmonicolor]